MPRKLEIKGPPDEPVELKLTWKNRHKRRAALRAKKAGVELAVWARLVLIRELEDPRDK